MTRGRKTGGRDWVPGVSGNPLGANRHSPETKALRKMKLTRQDIVELGVELTQMTQLELERIVNNPGSSGLRSAAASAILNARRTGEWERVDRLLDRVVGKVKEELHVTTGLHSLPDEDIDSELAELEKLDANSRSKN